MRPDHDRLRASDSRACANQERDPAYAYLALGASLYVPATRSDLNEIVLGNKISGLRSTILCTEDSVDRQDVDQSLRNIERLLKRIGPKHERGRALCFVRPRNPEVLSSLLGMTGIQNIDGFVFPKITQWNLRQYMCRIPSESTFSNMLTLETAETFEPEQMRALRQRIVDERWQSKILSLRIGGNDMLQCLGMRRPRDRTLYETPLALVVSQLVTIFRPIGLNLTAPVFEYFDRHDLLAKECRSDLAHGLFGKSSVHPSQIAVIEKEYRVSEEDFEMACQIVQPSAPSVFRIGQAMCETKTHLSWAKATLMRAEIYGISPASHSNMY